MNRTLRSIVIGAGCSALVSACTDSLIAPFSAPPPAEIPKITVGNKIASFGVEFSPSNENRCEERTAVTDASGKIVGWTKRPSQVAPQFAQKASEVSAYSILTFSKHSSKQVSQFDCVLQTGSEALPFMRDHLASRQSRPVLNALGLTTAFSWEGGNVTCEWDGWSLTCDGDSCSRGYAIYVSSASGSNPLHGTSAVIDLGALGSWHCGPCNVFISEDGSVYNCGDDDPSGGGEGDEGGGSTGGNGPTECDPRTDPDCIKDLRPEDRTSITNAMQHLRPASEFSADSIYQACAAALAQFQNMYPESIRRGGTDSPSHSGMGHAGLIHIDEGYLDHFKNHEPGWSEGYLLGLLLHEAAHFITVNGIQKWSHAEGQDPTTYPFPYNHMFAFNSQDSCAK